MMAPVFSYKAVINLFFCQTLQHQSGKPQVLSPGTGSLSTINDSGNSPTLFQLDSRTGNIVNNYHLKEITNMVWEAITRNDSFIFIGDFGNNPGNRQDLRIVKIHNPLPVTQYRRQLYRKKWKRFNHKNLPM